MINSFKIISLLISFIYFKVIYHEGKENADNLVIKFFETSTKNSKNVEDLFLNIIE